MKIAIHATEHIVDLNGVPCRLWEGVTEKGTPCKVFVHRLAVAPSENQEEFEQELATQLPPGVKIDLRHVL